MAKANQVVPASVSDVKPVNQFVATLGEFKSEISQSADMLVSVEKLEGNIADTKAGLGSIVYGVLVSQAPSVLAGDVYAGEPVVLGWHDAVRLSFGDSYKSAKGGMLSDDAVNMAWSRVMKLLADDYGYVKPKAETKGAEAKAEKRAKQAELLAAYEAVPVADLKSQAKALYNKAGDGDKEAKKQADLIIKAIDLKSKSFDTELKASIKLVRSEIIALVKQVEDLSILNDVAEALASAVMDSDNS